LTRTPLNWTPALREFAAHHLFGERPDEVEEGELSDAFYLYRAQPLRPAIWVGVTRQWHQSWMSDTPETGPGSSSA
jgi:hypothetical protein